MSLVSASLPYKEHGLVPDIPSLRSCLASVFLRVRVIGLVAGSE